MTGDPEGRQAWGQAFRTESYGPLTLAATDGRTRPDPSPDPSSGEDAFRKRTFLN
jgi:hypothetical protein